MISRIICLLFCVSYTLSAWSTIQSQTHEYEFENGLKLLVREDHRAPVVVSQIWYKVGSSYEHEGITGISHMLEHMMFKGTPKFPGNKLAEIVAEKGGKQNAFTGYDYTVYFQQFAKQHLALSFELEADRMQNLILNQDLLTPEKQVVAEERRWRIDDQPQAAAQEVFFSQAFLTNPYRHPVIGTSQDIQQYTLKDLKEWYDTWYVPNNAVLVVVGDVVPDEVFALAKQYFGDIPQKTIPEVKTFTLVPQPGERQIKLKKKAKLPLLLIGYNVPSLKTAEVDWEPYALDLLLAVLQGNRSARFEKEIMRENKIALDVDTWYQPASAHSTVLMMSGEPSPDHNLVTLEKAFRAQVQRLQNELVTDKELEIARVNLVASRVYQKDSMFYQAYEMGMLEATNLTWNLGEDYIDNIHAVKPSQIQAVAKKYLNADRITITYLNPTTEEGASHG
jgi:zinc protease